MLAWESSGAERNKVSIHVKKKMRTIRWILVPVSLGTLALGGCGPSEGSPEWCKQMQAKSPQQLSEVSQHDREVFVQKCVGLQ